MSVTAWDNYNSYVEGLEESVVEAREFAANVSTYQNDNIMEDLKAQRIQTDKAMEKMQ